jgi:hypothetical protein
VTSFHHQPEAHHPKSSAIHKLVGRLPHLWGAPRIHGELLKLGIDVGQTTVAKYMARRRRPPSQGWKTFLRNHADGIASMDLSWSRRSRFGCCTDS